MDAIRHRSYGPKPMTGRGYHERRTARIAKDDLSPVPGQVHAAPSGARSHPYSRVITLCARG